MQPGSAQGAAGQAGMQLGDAPASAELRTSQPVGASTRPASGAPLICHAQQQLQSAPHGPANATVHYRPGCVQLPVAPLAAEQPPQHPHSHAQPAGESPGALPGMQCATASSKRLLILQADGTGPVLDEEMLALLDWSVDDGLAEASWTSGMSP